MSYHVVSPWKCSMYVLKKMYVLLLWGKMFYILIKYISSIIVQFHNILVDVLFWRSTHFWQWGVKSPSISVLLSISFFMSSKIFLMYLGAPVLDAYMFIIFMSSWWILPLRIMKCPSVFLFLAFVLKSILSDVSIATPTLLFLSICLEYFFLSNHLQSV